MSEVWGDGDDLPDRLLRGVRTNDQQVREHAARCRAGIADRPRNLLPWPGIWVADLPVLQPGLHCAAERPRGEPMNTITIVLLALNGAVQAIGLAEGFVTNQEVRKIMEDVRQAIMGAIGALQPHQRAAQEHARSGQPTPTQAPSQSEGGEQPEAEGSESKGDK